MSLGAEVGKMIPNKGIPFLLLMQKSSRSLVFTCVCVCVCVCDREREKDGCIVGHPLFCYRELTVSDVGWRRTL